MNISTIALAAIIKTYTVSVADAFKNARHIKKSSPAQVFVNDASSSVGAGAIAPFNKERVLMQDGMVQEDAIALSLKKDTTSASLDSTGSRKLEFQLDTFSGVCQDGNGDGNTYDWLKLTPPSNDAPSCISACNDVGGFADYGVGVMARNEYCLCAFDGVMTGAKPNPAGSTSNWIYSGTGAVGGGDGSDEYTCYAFADYTTPPPQITTFVGVCQDGNEGGGSYDHVKLYPPSIDASSCISACNSIEGFDYYGVGVGTRANYCLCYFDEAMDNEISNLESNWSYNNTGAVGGGNGDSRYTCYAFNGYGSTSSWSLDHNRMGSSANFTSGTGDEGVVTSAWDLQAPNLPGSDPNKSYNLKTIIKKDFCSGDDDVEARNVDSNMVSGGLIDQAEVIDKGVGETKSCMLVTPGGSYSKECVYKFDKATMGPDVGYDAATGVQRLCEIAQLQWNNMVIMEQYINYEVEFDLSQNFTVAAVSMTAATIEASNQNTSLADYISASQCAGPGTTLAPNDVLCIRISSSSPDVLIEKIDKMDITGHYSVQQQTLQVYDGLGIKYSAITSETYSPVNSGPERQRIEVRTRVPPNMFDFEADDAKIDISGSVTVQFNGSRRHLSVVLDRLLQANEGEESAEFYVAINLVNEPKLALEDGDAMMNSAKAMKAFATFGMVFAFTFALW